MKHEDGFAALLKQSRLSAGLSQRKLADLLAVDSSLISKYERAVNAVRPDADRVRALIDALGGTGKVIRVDIESGLWAAWGVPVPPTLAGPEEELVQSILDTFRLLGEDNRKGRDVLSKICRLLWRSTARAMRPAGPRSWLTGKRRASPLPKAPSKRVGGMNGLV